MKIHDLIQGSPQWLAYRAGHFNASDAPAMMGVSPYKTRADLLRELHTGVVPQVDAGTQKRFDNGHRLEALARPLAEEFIGAELYPVTGSSGKLSASFDGLTLGEDIGFEHKKLNAELKAIFSRGSDDESGSLLPAMHRIQMEQQLLVSGAEKVLFMASEWTAEDDLVEEHHCWYHSDAKLRAQIVGGWEQFEKDLVAYELPPESKPAAVGKAPETLPALHIQVTGEVTASNLAEFKQTALTAIRSVNRELTTDAEFANAEKAVKWCDEVEKRLAAAKQHALGQTASIDALFKTIDDISAEARTVRLDLSKLVTRRKTEVKEEAVTAARRALAQHIETLNAELTGGRLPTPVVDFAGAIKGLRSFDSMQDALDSTLAVAKISADAAARAIRTNMAAFKERAAGFEFLFADIAQLVHKASDDFSTLLQARIDAHKVAEAEKKRKADETAAELKRKVEADEAARVASVATTAAVVPVVPPPAAAPALVSAAAPPAAPVRTAAFATTPRPDEPATLKLGAICDRLGFAMTAAFVAETLGLKPAKVEGSAKLYRESDFGRICIALRQHIADVSEAIAA